ncbi:hypothetical protein [Halegenticoccus tardaugens]|uniref:hypothetical protein n=1 Tax=Halegenticoccus tardaugens TaxID=2071624 RepID=UPI00100C2092|nr:hypothetical protein [Halegenticoccus tardaugens]
MREGTDDRELPVRTRLKILRSNVETLSSIATAVAEHTDPPRARHYADAADAFRDEALAIDDALQSGTEAEQEEAFRLAIDNLVEFKSSLPPSVVRELDERAIGRLDTFR